jgi:hypothetical protein
LQFLDVRKYQLSLQYSPWQNILIPS